MDERKKPRIENYFPKILTSPEEDQEKNNGTQG
jgi:hypothetical protein